MTVLDELRQKTGWTDQELGDKLRELVNEYWREYEELRTTLIMATAQLSRTYNENAATTLNFYGDGIRTTPSLRAAQEYALKTFPKIGEKLRELDQRPTAKVIGIAKEFYQAQFPLSHAIGKARQAIAGLNEEYAELNKNEVAQRIASDRDYRLPLLIEVPGIVEGVKLVKS
jgi:hypothetical protein